MDMKLINHTLFSVWSFEDGDSGVLSQDFNYMYVIIFYNRHSVRIPQVVWFSFTQQLFSDYCIPYALIALHIHVDSACHLLCALLHLRTQVRVCIGGIIMCVGVKTTLLQWICEKKKKKKRKKFFWREFWPFTKISRRENNLVWYIHVHCTCSVYSITPDLKWFPFYLSELGASHRQLCLPFLCGCQPRRCICLMLLLMHLLLTRDRLTSLLLEVMLLPTLFRPTLQRQRGRILLRLLPLESRPCQAWDSFLSYLHFHLGSWCHSLHFLSLCKMVCEVHTIQHMYTCMYMHVHTHVHMYSICLISSHTSFSIHPRIVVTHEANL